MRVPDSRLCGHSAVDPGPERRLRVALVMRPAALVRHLLGPTALRRLNTIANVHPVVLEDLTSAEAKQTLASTDVLMTGWGAPLLTDEIMEAAPRLSTVIHMGGQASALLGPAARRRGLRLTNTRRANSQPVSEYALAMILLSRTRSRCQPNQGAEQRVGIIGASTTGRMTIELLRGFDIAVSVYDPYLSAAEADKLGVAVQDLEELLASCPVISIHAPEIPETKHMINARRLTLIPDGATLINTARGSLIDTDALVAELRTQRFEAILDVTDPEPLPPDHPLWQLPNVLITPHVAGSMGNELLRLGDAAVAEVEQLAAGLPAVHPELSPELLRITKVDHPPAEASI